MSSEMKSKEQQVYGLLQFLYEKNPDIRISRERLRSLIFYMLHGENIEISPEQRQHEQLLNTLESSGVLVQNSNHDSIDQAKIKEALSGENFTPLSDAEVRYQLARVLGYEQCATCKSSDPEKHLVMVYLNLTEPYHKSLLALIEKFREQMKPDVNECILLDEHRRASEAWIYLAREKQSTLSS